MREFRVPGLILTGSGSSLGIGVIGGLHPPICAPASISPSVRVSRLPATETTEGSGD